MSYRNTDAPDDSTVQVTLTIGQIKQLDKLVDSDLANAEQHGESMVPEKELQRLTNIFWPFLRIKLTEEEEIAHIKQLRIQWARDELEALCPES